MISLLHTTQPPRPQIPNRGSSCMGPGFSSWAAATSPDLSKPFARPGFLYIAGDGGSDGGACVRGRSLGPIASSSSKNDSYNRNNGNSTSSSRSSRRRRLCRSSAVVVAAAASAAATAETPKCIRPCSLPLHLCTQHGAQCAKPFHEARTELVVAAIWNLLHGTTPTFLQPRFTIAAALAVPEPTGMECVLSGLKVSWNPIHSSPLL